MRIWNQIIKLLDFGFSYLFCVSMEFKIEQSNILNKLNRVKINHICKFGSKQKIYNLKIHISFK